MSLSKTTQRSSNFNKIYDQPSFKQPHTVSLFCEHKYIVWIIVSSCSFPLRFSYNPQPPTNLLPTQFSFCFGYVPVYPQEDSDTIIYDSKRLSTHESTPYHWLWGNPFPNDPIDVLEDVVTTPIPPIRLPWLVRKRSGMENQRKKQSKCHSSRSKSVYEWGVCVCERERCMCACVVYGLWHLSMAWYHGRFPTKIQHFPTIDRPHLYNISQRGPWLTSIFNSVSGSSSGDFASTGQSVTPRKAFSKAPLKIGSASFGFFVGDEVCICIKR